VTVDVRVRDDDVRPAPVAARPWEATPTYQRMRERVLAQLTGPDAGTTAGIVTTETIRWMLNESAQIRARAGTLARFSEEWPSDRLDRLDLDALAEWQTIVRDHAVDVGQRAETLRDRVAAFLPPGSAPAPLPAVDALTGPSDAERLIRRLSELASLQQTVLTAALSVGAPPPPEIRTSHLDEALTHLVAIAAVFASPWPLSR
jgi:hypothetical protein